MVYNKYLCYINKNVLYVKICLLYSIYFLSFSPFTKDQVEQIKNTSMYDIILEVTTNDMEVQHLQSKVFYLPNSEKGFLLYCFTLILFSILIIINYIQILCGENSNKCRQFFYKI